MVVSSTEKDGPASADTRKSCQKFSYIKYALLIMMILVSTVFMKSFYYRKLKESLLSVAFQSNELCSGHGIVMNDSNCICDLGYQGEYCESQKLSDANDVMLSSVAIFTDAFGPLNSKDVLSLYYESLARNLKNSGHLITVIYTGGAHSQFDRISDLFKSQGINLIMLESGVTVEQKPFAAYAYLRSLPKDFSTVIFSSSSHTAYYTMKSVHQGLLLTKTKFILSLDDLSERDIELNQDPSYTPSVTDVSVLKKHYMTQESIKMAKQIISPAQSLISFYNVNTSAHILPHSPILESSSNIAFKDLKELHEIVFIGGSNNMDGIIQFCDAIDKIVVESAKALIDSKLTFFVFERNINGIPVKDYLEFRAEKWEAKKISWNWKIDYDYQKIIEYFDDSQQNRIAIVPSYFAGGSIIQSELIGSGIPIFSFDMEPSSEYSIMKDEIVKSILENEYNSDSLNDNQMAIWNLISNEVVSSFTSESSVTDTDLPLISVILVHHNRPELLKQAIASLEKQTYTNFEVVLVDDGSTDRAAISYVDELSWKWWEEKGWKVIREPNRYLGASRNTGVKHSNGKYVLFMDDDDYAKPHQIETFVKAALATKASVLTSGHDIFNGLAPPSGRSSLRYVPIGGDVLSGMLENVFGDSAMFIEREYFIESGGFTEEFGVGFEDYEYLAKIALRGDVMEPIAEPLHWYRIHQGTMSESTQLKANQLRVLRAYNLYNYNSDSIQKNLLSHVRDNFFKDMILDKREYLQFSSIFSNATADIAAVSTKYSLTISNFLTSSSTTSRTSLSTSLSILATTTVNAKPTYTGPEPVLELLDPSYIYDKPSKNVFGDLVNRKIVLVGKNFGDSPVLQILKLDGKRFNVTYDPAILVLKNNTLNSAQKVLVIDQSVIDNRIGSMSYRNGIIGGIFLTIFNDFGKSDTLPLYYSSKSFFKTEHIKYIYNSTAFQANIWLQNLIDAKKPSCILKKGADSGYGQQIAPAVYDRHSGQILCISGQPLSGTIYLTISAQEPLAYDKSISSNDYLAMISVNEELFTFKNQDVAPVMISAIFDNSGAFVAIAFDKGITIRGEDRDSNLYCSDVFVNNADRKSNSPILSKVKEDCIISRINSFTIQITFGGEFLVNNPNTAIKPFDKLYLKLNTVYNSNNLNPFTGRGASGSIIVLPPNSPPEPKINIQNSPIIGGCSDFLMSFSAMAGSGGRPFISLKFSVTPPLGAPAFLSAAELETLLNKEAGDILMGKRSQILITSDKLSSLNNGNGVYAGLYNVSVVLKNFWGKTGTKSYSFQFSKDKLLPNVLLNGPGYVGVDSRKDNSIFALVTLSSSSSCASIAKASYKFNWTLSGPANVPLTSRTSSLLIRPLSLQPSTSYVASLIVSVRANDEVMSYSYSYIFSTSPDSFTSSLGSNKQIGDIQDFRLSPEIKNDFYRILNYSNYNFVWQCSRGGLPCTNKEAVILNLAEYKERSSSGLEFIKIPGDTLSVGSYTFTVNATNKITGTVGQQIDTEIEVVTGRVPDVSITSTVKKPSTFDSKFEIVAKIVKESVSSLKNVQFLWTSEQLCDSTSYDTVPMDESTLVTKRSSSSLKFKTDVLVPGASYCFSLFVQDSGTKTNSTSFYVTKIRSRPSSGSCIAANTVDNVVTIRSLLDDFSFNCASWITDEESYPLLYSFEIQKKGSKNWVSVSRNTPDSSLTMSMLEGEYIARAHISDQSGSRAASPVSINVNVTKLSFGGFSLRKRDESDQFYNFVGEWLSNRSITFQSTQNIQGFSSALSTVATLPFDQISRESQKKLQAKSFDSINTIMESGLLTFDEDSVGYLANQIQTFSGINCSIPSENLNSSLALVYSLLDKANITSMDLGESLTSETLNKLMGTYSNLTCASGGSLSKNLLSKKNSLLQKVSAIALRRAGCGEIAYQSNYTDLEVQVGREVASEYLISSERSFGIFNLTVSNDLLATCAPYITGKKSSNGIEYPTKDNIDASVYQMSYLSDSGIPRNISSGQISVKFTVPLKNPALLNANQPMCSFLKFLDDNEDISTAKLSQEGCEELMIDTVSGKVTCLCDHLSDFVIAYTPAKVLAISSATTFARSAIATRTAIPTATPTATQSSLTIGTTPTAFNPAPTASQSGGSSSSGSSSSTVIAAAVGGSIGAILIIGAALYVGLKVLPKRAKKYSPGAENDSRNDQVMIGIPGPSNEGGNNPIVKDKYPSDTKNADFS